MIVTSEWMMWEKRDRKTGETSCALAIGWMSLCGAALAIGRLPLADSRFPCRFPWWIYSIT